MTKVTIKIVDGKVVTLINEQDTSANVTDFDPSDLLAGALGKCTNYEVRKFARKKEYDLKNLEVRVDLDKDNETKTANFKVHLDVEGDLSEGELKELHKAARKSYINRLLSNNINLDSDIHHNGKKIKFT